MRSLLIVSWRAHWGEVLCDAPACDGDRRASAENRRWKCRPAKGCCA